MHRRSVIATAALAGMAFGLLLGDLVTGSGPVSLFGTSASHDDPITETVADDSTPGTSVDDSVTDDSGPDDATGDTTDDTTDDSTPGTAPADGDRTSTTFPDDDDDDRTSTTLPDGDEDRTSTTFPDDDDDDEAVTSEVRSFSASDAATITVRRTGDRLEIVSINSNEGWLQEIKDDGGDKVEVRFEGHDRRVEFRAEVDSGVISTRVRDEAR